MHPLGATVVALQLELSLDLGEYGLTLGTATRITRSALDPSTARLAGLALAHNTIEWVLSMLLHGPKSLMLRPDSA